MLNTEAGARIQVFGAGGGYGYMTNITFQDIKCFACNTPIVIDQCVGTSNCASSPSKMLINDIRFILVTGRGAQDKQVVSMVCEMCVAISLP